MRPSHERQEPFHLLHAKGLVEGVAVVRHDARKRQRLLVPVTRRGGRRRQQRRERAGVGRRSAGRPVGGVEAGEQRQEHVLRVLPSELPDRVAHRLLEPLGGTVEHLVEHEDGPREEPLAHDGELIEAWGGVLPVGRRGRLAGLVDEPPPGACEDLREGVGRRGRGLDDDAHESHLALAEGVALHPRGDLPLGEGGGVPVGEEAVRLVARRRLGHGVEEELVPRVRPKEGLDRRELGL
mmetsp:Transcript_6647/g.15109  ORF Transcript_6647/g.15109 Transcript_6647/m.15109 type:complete len:238 (+) Transcript_6647:117-830(+)